MTRAVPPGWCQHCARECQDVRGSEVWPNAGPGLADKIIWRCPSCGARVGSHPDGSPLGTAADAKLREARIYVHGLLDPLWQKADRHPAYAGSTKDAKGLAVIRRTARRRVYRWLSTRMALDFEDCHVAMMDIEECRVAYRALRGLTYDEVRAWATENPEPEAPGKRPPHRRKARARHAET